MFWRRSAKGWFVFLALAGVGPWPLLAQLEFDQPPISYSSTPSRDSIARLAEGLQSGSTTLAWDPSQGWLPALLNVLEVPRSSQTLVFSKTSLQIRHISPTNPRALYFSDTVYLGWVPGGDLIELSAVDDLQGPIFYTLRQARVDRPEIRRDESQCLTCHATSKTLNVPGYLVRSVFPGADGHPIFSLGTTTTSPATAFKDRFGGWYVTGAHGDLRHRGNGLARNIPERPLDCEAGANLNAVPDAARIERYLEPTSDIVALMVLEHQSQLHNLLTRVHYETRQALEYQATLNRALDRPAEFRSESTQRRIQAAVEQLLRGLLFSEEYQLTSPVVGNSKFQSEFESLGPWDGHGRSLRQFDLTRRMFRYPCSYLIYSAAFDSLPSEAMRQVRQRFMEILEGHDRSTEFSHLSPGDRRAIREILEATKPGLFSPQALDPGSPGS